MRELCRDLTYQLLIFTEASQVFARALIVTPHRKLHRHLVSVTKVDADVFRIAAARNTIYAPLSIAWWIWTNIDGAPLLRAQWRILPPTVSDVTMVALTMAIADGAGARCSCCTWCTTGSFSVTGCASGRPHLDAATALSVFSLSIAAIASRTLALGVGLRYAHWRLVMVQVFPSAAALSRIDGRDDCQPE